MPTFNRSSIFTFVSAILMLFSCTPVYSQPVADSSTAEAKPSASGSKAAGDMGMSPKEVYLAVNKAMANADKATIKKHVVPTMPDGLSEFIENLTPEMGQGLAKRMENVSAADGAEFGDLALVIKFDRGESFPDGLDTDPVFLHKMDGQWRLVLNEGPAIATYFKNCGLADSFEKAAKWYGEHEAEVRKAFAAKNK